MDCCNQNDFLARGMFIFIFKVFRTIVFIFIVFIFIVISTTFRSICPPAFFRCLSNSGTFTELRTTSFIETTRVTCSVRPKRCGNNNKDEDNSPKTLYDKNHQVSSQKFRQLISSVEITIKMKTIVRKPLMIKIIELRLRNLDN